MEIISIPRVFIHKVNGQEVRLTDPNETFSVTEVQNFFAGTYPILTNAKVLGPKFENDEQVYRFESTMGVKG